MKLLAQLPKNDESTEVSTRGDDCAGQPKADVASTKFSLSESSSQHFSDNVAPSYRHLGTNSSLQPIWKGREKEGIIAPHISQLRKKSVTHLSLNQTQYPNTFGQRTTYRRQLRNRQPNQEISDCTTQSQ